MKKILGLFLVATLSLTACGGGGGGSSSSSSGSTGGTGGSGGSGAGSTGGSGASTSGTTVPSAPTGVSVTAGDGQVTIGWAAVTGATSYNVYYGTSTGVTTSSPTKSTGITATSKTIAGLTNGTAYYFIVTAVNAGGESVASSEVSTTPQVAAPTGISPTVGNGQATVRWMAVTGATSYNVYYGTSSGVTVASTMKSTGITGTSKTITGLTNGTTYYFIVTAVDAGGESATSMEVYVTPVAVSTSLIPATGQATCYDTSGAIISCVGAGQDGSYINNPLSYADNGNGTITDNVTTLMWQKQDDGTTRNLANAITYCNGLALGGYTDWRLPSRMDIITIVNFGTSYPAIDTTYFPGTQSLSPYGASTIYASNTNFVWRVIFDDGTVKYEDKTYNAYIRCVRGQQTTQSFTDNGNGTITDNVTTLMWQKQDDGTTRLWADAITYCNGLALGGYTDWRLPNIKELMTIVDDSVYNPAVNTTYFPGTQSLNYWSSTTDAMSIMSVSVTDLAWIVSFSDGKSDIAGKPAGVGNYVRCVRP